MRPFVSSSRVKVVAALAALRRRSAGALPASAAAAL